MIIDLHIHTSISPCCRMDIEDIIERAKDRNLDGLCVTDHDTTDIRHVIPEGIQKNGVYVFFGMEYSTPQGDFLVFSPSDETVPPNLSAEMLLKLVRDAGGVAVAAHPFREKRPTDEQVIRNGLCGAIECINGRNTALENSAAEKWRKCYELTGCGGSDAHTLDEVGTFATRFTVPIRSRLDLIQGLKNQLCRPEIPLS